MFNSKNYINEEFNLVNLGSANYPNLKFADKTKQDSVNKSLLDDINTAAKSVGIVATITTAKTGHNKTTKGSNNISRHMNGTGVDVSILDGMNSNGSTNATNGSPEFREKGFKMKDALVSMGYVWNTESGKDKAVLWHTNTGGNHYNHLHISNRTGSSSSAPSIETKPEDVNLNNSSTEKLNDKIEDNKTNSTTSNTNIPQSEKLFSSRSKLNENILEDVLRIQDILNKIL